MSVPSLVQYDEEGRELRSVPLEQGLTIGRDRDCDVVLNDDVAVSRKHAEICRESDGVYVLRDLASANGTSVNQRRLVAPAILRNGDKIQLGASRFRLVGLPDDETPTTERPVDLTNPRERRRPVLMGRSEAISAVIRQIDQCAPTDLAVLLEGETGTGKELVARAIHESSRRSAGSFVALNCAAIPHDLLEAQLFGHRRGAFTGATSDVQGFFEVASGGTLFLDEIGELPLGMQPKILRAIQEGSITPVGETTSVDIDVRVIAATNRDLREAARQGLFREDLYYRLEAFPIEIPTLRVRRDDIQVLAETFVTDFCRRNGKRPLSIHDEAVRTLESYPWPGNIRELQNEVSRAAAVAEESEILVEHLSTRVRFPEPNIGKRDESDLPDNLAEARRSFEKGHVGRVLAKHGGKRAEAAEALGLSRAGLYKKMKELELL